MRSRNGPNSEERYLTPLDGKKVARVATVPFAIATQANRQIEHIVEGGADVTLITSAGEELNRVNFGPRLRHLEVEIPRKLRPWRDLMALIKLVRIFRSERFDIVHSTTPKAGLLCAIGGVLARVPIRLHTFTGQTWVTLNGIMREVAKLADRIIGSLCTHCYADSHSQMRFLIQQGIVASEKISVIGSGSLAGIDLQRFDPERFSKHHRVDLKSHLGIYNSNPLLIFVGRVCKDKGVWELLEALEILRGEGKQTELLLLGPFDASGAEDLKALEQKIGELSNVHFLGYVKRPEEFLAISDIMCLPSYREGFGTVVLEAAALRVPTVGSAIYGLSDAIVDGETGLLAPPKDAPALAKVISKLLDNPELRENMSDAARRRCVEEFDDEKVSANLIDAYVHWLGQTECKSTPARIR